MFMRCVHIPVVGVFLILLASCGGSGSDGANPPPPPPTNTAMLPITAANAQDITVAVLEAVTSSVEIVDIIDIIDIPVVASSKPGIAGRQFAAIFTETLLCDTGQATVTWDDADNNLDLSTGDTFEIAFEMCFFADTGTTLDGTMSLTNLVVTGDYLSQIPPWGLATTLGFIDLSGTDSAGTSIIDGTLDLDISSDDNVVINLSVGTASLSVQDSGESESLSEYLLTQTIDLNTLMQVINADGTYTSTVLGGNVTFETLVDFTAIGDDSPSAGQLLISDSTSSVLVRVLDNISVQLEIDLEQDGTIDETIVVTWAELDIG